MDINFLSANAAEMKMNKWGSEGREFVFIIDFSGKNCLLAHTEEAAEMGFIYNFRGISNVSQVTQNGHLAVTELGIEANPPAFREYLKAFEFVKHNIDQGNTYLANLCFESELKKCPGFSTIFSHASAPYKIWLENKFIAFSPESFVKIEEGKIMAFPMKGTINAAGERSANHLLEDPKELAEHYTIVDLLRNDISIVAKNVQVDRFRYLDEVRIGKRTLLQTSSAISGILPSDYRQHIGTIIFKMLPAGSVTGAPKKKTVEILMEAENFDRGFYTGVSGIYKEGRLDSCVLIRFIEKRGKKYFYKSGGGITFQSKAAREYEELKEKIYVPFS